MTEYIERFRSKINESDARAAFPEITDSETPVWRGGPSTLSMADKYILSVVVLLVHLAFFVGEWKEPPEILKEFLGASLAQLDERGLPLQVEIATHERPIAGRTVRGEASPRERVHVPAQSAAHAVSQDRIARRSRRGRSAVSPL